MRMSVQSGAFVVLMLGTVLGYPQTAQAAVFLSENWDTGTPPADWPCKNFPDAVATAPFNEWEGQGFIPDNSPFAGGKLSGLSTAIYHSAPRSYYQHRPANDYWTCTITKELPQPNPTKIHLRFFIYFTDNWLGFDNPPASTYEATHFIFTNSALSGTGFRFNIEDKVSTAYPYECNNDQAFSGMYFAIENGSNGGRRGTQPYDCYNLRENLNRWQCVEFMVDTANGDGTVDGPYGTKNGRYSQWIDGDLKVDYVSTPVSQSDFQRIMVSGFSSFLRDFTGDFYIDDIAVADSYIGCSASFDTLAPAAPTNLSVQ